MDHDDRITHLEAQVTRLTALLENQGRLVSTADEGNDGTAGSPSTSRRDLLKLAGAAAVGAVGASVAGATPAGATTGTMSFGTSNDAGTDLTSLTSSNSTDTLVVTNTGNGGALFLGDALEGTGTGLEVNLQNSSNPSPGVVAIANGSALVGVSNDRFGLSGLGGAAPLFLNPSATAGPPTTGSHGVGEIFVDVNGGLFQCVAAGTPGTWVRAGFNPLTPVRILDTRNGTGGITGPLGPGQIVSLTVGGNNGVPTQASSVVMNATVTDTTSASFLTIWPEGASQPLASNLNWSAGETIPNQVTVKLGTSAGISIFNDLGDVQVILDLAGFYS